MSEAKRAILERIREGLNSALLPDSTPERPTHDVPRDTGGVAEFIAEVERISGQVIRVGTAVQAARTVADLCVEQGYQGAFCWSWDAIGCAGLDEALKADGIQIVQDESMAELAMLPVGITGAEAALADTGTLVMRNGAGTPSLASLLPPVHIAVVNVARIFADMQSYFNSLDQVEAYVQETSNLVFVSGPSRTADIEQTLTLGAHGPREVIIILWGN